jgi:hypothetical protein
VKAQGVGREPHRPAARISSLICAVVQPPDVHDLLHRFEPSITVGTADRAVHAARGAERVA